jgi:two-component system, sensor histidine kinase and response regulator
VAVQGGLHTEDSELNMTTTETLAQIAQAIEEAKASLDSALTELDRLPAFDASTIGFVAHAMNNYLTITDATVSLLTHELRTHPNRDVGVWLDGLRHTAALMDHTMGRLLRASTPSQFPLKPDHVNVPVLMERACEYYQRVADSKRLKISCNSVGEVPPAWADRVALAVVADNLLSNAVKFSKAGDTIDVQVMSDPEGVVCSVRDRGPGISEFEQARFLQRAAAIGTSTEDNDPAGFGLRISKEFIDRMGGKFWIESERGQGARISFRLPYGANRGRSAS